MQSLYKLPVLKELSYTILHTSSFCHMTASKHSTCNAQQHRQSGASCAALIILLPSRQQPCIVASILQFPPHISILH